MITLTVPGQPVSKARPRLGHGHTYTPRKTKDAEGRVAAYLKASYPHVRPTGYGQFAVYLAFYLKGAPRLDIDNLLKLILDSLNGRVWLDDNQVAVVHAQKYLHADSPRTEVSIEQCSL